MVAADGSPVRGVGSVVGCFFFFAGRVRSLFVRKGVVFERPDSACSISSIQSPQGQGFVPPCSGWRPGHNPPGIDSHGDRMLWSGDNTRETLSHRAYYDGACPSSWASSHLAAYPPSL